MIARPSRAHAKGKVVVIARPSRAHAKGKVVVIARLQPAGRDAGKWSS